MSKVMLSIGHGYSAGALGLTLLADGWRVYGTTRSADKALSLQAQGITPIVWPDTDLSPFIEKASHVLTGLLLGTLYFGNMGKVAQQPRMNSELTQFR